MRRLIAKHPALTVNLLVLALAAGLTWFMNGWVFRTLPFDAEVATLDRQIALRHAFARLLKPDSLFQGALTPLRDDGPHPDVVLLNIGYDILAEEDSWPLPRSVVARIFEALAVHKPKTVLVDMVFEWPQTPWVTEAVNRAAAENGGRDALTLMRQLNHDGQLKAALGKLDYVLAYFYARGFEFAVPAQRNASAANMARQATSTRIRVTGDGEAEVFPFQRIIGIRNSILALQLRAKGQGFAWVAEDRYRTAGQIPLVHRLESRDRPPQSFYLMNAVAEAVRVYAGADEYAMRVGGGEARDLTIGEHVVRTDPAGEMLINYYGRGLDPLIPIVRAHDLLAGKVDPAALAGKLVLVGSDINLLHDYQQTPVGSLWGTEIMAFAVSNILSGDYLHRPPWADGAELALLAVAMAVVFAATGFLAPLPALAIVAPFAAAVAALIGYLFVTQGMVLSVTIPVGFTFLMYLLNTVTRFILDERQKRLFATALGLYLSPELTRRVSEEPALLTLDGSEEELTVLFSDIRGFTSISETMTPEQLTSFLQ